VKQKTVVTLDTMWAAMEAVAKDGVSVTLKNGLQQFRVIAGIVLEVCVLNEDNFAGGVGEPGANAGAFPLVLVVERELDNVLSVGIKLGLQIALLKKFAGPVGREVDDDDELFAKWYWLLRDLLQEPHDCVALVVDRNDGGERLKMIGAAL